ncbi:MAG: ferritin, partial [Deltaproteobacteria bacterium]|nr:ferritin [Deltaproteobacteria bacterium]
FESPMDMFKKTLDHEKFITKSINELVDLATEEKDHATGIFLQWFVTEQIEEEGNDNDIINQLKLIGDNGNGLIMLDRELGGRVFTPETTP